MKLRLFYSTILVVCFGTLVATSAGNSSPVSVAYQSKDSSILKPTDVAYAEAMKFAQFLNSKGITVQSVHGSKLNGFFRGLNKAAFFRTDKGVVEVIFFPEPTGAEKVRVTEQRREGRYHYSFEGQPEPNSHGDRIDAGRPMYFHMHRNWFIVLSSEGLYDALRRALTKN
ncbi:MAG TPA: hypothetical protein VGB73_13215 [Pyrinomonadaceae bacterium]|jgi:hypothetical protein